MVEEVFRKMVSQIPNILVVDDEQVICDLLSQELKEQGYQVTAALDGNSALTLLREENFDVVLLDIRLPGISGIDVLREIWLNYPHVATIMVTAVNDISTSVEAMKLGAADYVVKPFDLDKLNSTIKDALVKQRATLDSDHIDAIASGVKAKLDPYSAYSKVVTEKTVSIARQLGIAEMEIQKWVEEKGTTEPDERKKTG